MRNTSMILMSDFYKQAHAEQYPEGITKLISYATARMTRIPKEMYGDKLTVFGIQSYVKDFLIERFNDTFFNVPLEEAMAEYEMIIGDTFPLQYVNTGKFEALHKLGYLPVEVGCLAEGTRVPIRAGHELPEGQCQVPFMYIVNTHPDFPWITEFLESVTSSEVWYPMAIANQAYYYRNIVNEWYDKTGVDPVARKSAISEFGFRGGKSSDAAIKASSAFLTSFNKTATIPAIKYLHDYYGDPIKEIGGGMISTEHSVMCSNFAVDGDEETFLKKLFSKLYPTGNVSVVMDTYDYWENLKRCGEGELKEIIMNRPGTVFFRGDSGDPVDIICGKQIKHVESLELHRMSRGWEREIFAEDEQCYYILRKEDGNDIWEKHTEAPIEYLGTVELLWDMFGGTVNEKGYKVLDSHVRAIYGDSITPNRARQMYERLAEKGFAANNVALGAGSFSTQCAETSDGKLLPFTRDSYGIAVKCCYCAAEEKESVYTERALNNPEVIEQVKGKDIVVYNTECSHMYRVHINEDGSIKDLCESVSEKDLKKTIKEYQVFKNPKTDTGKFKKSQKGLIFVTEKNGEIVAYDGYTIETLPKNGNLLQPIFRDGQMIKETSLTEIRNRLHNNDF